MVLPSGEQFEIGGGGYRAIVTECGASLRLLEYDGRPLVLGWPAEEQTASGRGQLLAPWPNRIRDGRYRFDDRDLQLPLSEPARHNASHGLVRWVPWTLEELTPQSVSLVLRLMSQTGYPWTLDLHVLFDISAAGLTVTFTATNLSTSPAPYALGAHPYLTTGTGPVDAWELTLPCDTTLLVDDRMIPTGRQPVAGTDFDFRQGRTIATTSLDTAFTGLTRDSAGNAMVTVRDPRNDEGVVLWVDRHHSWLQVFTGDELPARARESLAVEPMTSPPNAFATSEDLLVLSPAGEDGDEHSCSWGIHTL
jgi:aldose 1-epimerase